MYDFTFNSLQKREISWELFKVYACLLNTLHEQENPTSSGNFIKYYGHIHTVHGLSGRFFKQKNTHIYLILRIKDRSKFLIDTETTESRSAELIHFDKIKWAWTRNDDSAWGKVWTKEQTHSFISSDF